MRFVGAPELLGLVTLKMSNKALFFDRASLYLEQPSLASKKRQLSVKIQGQFFDFQSRLVKVKEVGLYQKLYGPLSFKQNSSFEDFQ